MVFYHAPTLNKKGLETSFSYWSTKINFDELVLKATDQILKKESNSLNSSMQLDKALL